MQRNCKFRKVRCWRMNVDSFSDLDNVTLLFTYLYFLFHVLYCAHPMFSA